MTSSIDEMIQLAHLALAFGRQDRVTLHEDAETPESDTDHTVMLGFIACTVARSLDGYDPARVAELVLVHDVVEALCGDTNSFDMSKETRAEKERIEAEAAQTLRQTFGEQSWLIQTLDAYEEQEEPEARLVRYLDKMTPKLCHAFNACASVKRMGKSRDDLLRAHEEQYGALKEEYPEIEREVGSLLYAAMVLSEEAW